MPPAASTRSLASSRLQTGKVPVITSVFPAKGCKARSAGSPSSQCTPQARNCSTTSRLCGWSKKVPMLSATMGPTSSTSSSCSGVAAMMLSNWPKCRASAFAVASPTCRMPRPKTKRGKVVCFDFSKASSNLLADLSAIRSRPASDVKPSLYKSGKVRTTFASTSCSTNLSPKPSTSTARRCA